jgi:putative DNA primase/helicase
MTIPIQSPPMDPWAPGVRAADVPVVNGGEPNPFDGPSDEFETTNGPEDLTALRLQLRSNGHHPVPVTGPHVDIEAAGKRPKMNGWQTECRNATPEKIAGWARSQQDCTNTGLLCGGIDGVDIDVLDNELSAKLVSRAVELFGPTPLRRIGRAPKTLLVYRVEMPHKKLTTPDLFFGDDVKNKDAKAKVEILADGQQFVAFGIHPDTRAPYRWPERAPLDTAASEIPLVTFDALKKFVAEAERVLRSAGARTEREIEAKRNQERNKNGKIFAALRDNEKPSREMVEDALNHIPNDMDYDEWIRIGFALYEGLRASGSDLWERWSAQSHKNNPHVTARKWPSFASGRSITIGTLFYIAEQHGWRRRGSTGGSQKGAAAGGKSEGEQSDANEAQSSTNDLPIIQIKDGELSLLATRAEEMLIAAGVSIYQRGGALVRPIIETVDASHDRKTRVALLKVLDGVYTRDLLGRHATWVRWDARAKRAVPTNPPSEVAATILARAGDWTFPAIAGVISTPTMRPDGSLLLDAGYDEATRLLLVEPPPMPDVPDHPTKEDAEGALKLLEGLLTGFPFVDNVARAVALSAIITPVVRGAFPVTPMHASRAPTAGSGKSFLWDIVAAISIGQLMPVMSTGASEEETEKRLGAALMKGQPLISIDNISGELGGDALCQIIERPVVDIRILGRSETVRIEARGTSMFATGNNFVIVGDVCRRVITTNLDPAMEQPELRQFDFDPVERVLANRGQYIAAALTICRAYIVAGRPDKAPRLASFDGWSDTVRSALLWLGKEDPVKSMETARAEDPERVELSDMLEAWSAVIGIGHETRMKLTSALSKGLDMTRDHAGTDLEPTYPEFHAALLTMAQRSAGRSGKSPAPDARMFGKWLQRFKGRVVDGKRFKNLSDEKRGSQWWVERV